MAPTFRTRRISATIAGVSVLSLFAGVSPAAAQSSLSPQLFAAAVDAATTYAQPQPSGIDAVIARAESQLGTPYAWGGGNASGPTQGIRDGGVADIYGDYTRSGFDCSGLVTYAFAGAGISLPHYSGAQYLRGTPVALSDIERGDLIFYGPSGGDHVAIYLGDGMMIEAPGSGSVVKKSPVRWSGLSANAVRLL